MAERATRRLAAIVAADIVGYSALMSADEAGTLTRVRSITEGIVRPAVTEHGGRVVKTTGDGALLEFPSAVDAVLCAVAVQRAVAAHEAERPEAERIRYRIGVNLGDVLIEGDDVYGDGVNVAARLEALAEPGGVRVSGAVFQAVKGKLDLGFADLGAQKVKNIAEPVPTFRVLLDPADIGKLVKARRRPPFRALAALAALLILLAGAWYALNPPAPVIETPRLFVLPFRAATPEAEPYADAATENALLGFGRVRGMTIVPRATAITYKGVASDLATLAEKHGASHVLDGAVALADGRVEISARLRSVTNTKIYERTFSGPASGFFGLLAGLNPEITGALEIPLNPQEKAILAATPTKNVEAYLAYAQGMHHYLNGPWTETRDAIALMERALELDPDFSDALALNAHLNFLIWIRNWGAIRSPVRALAVSEAAVGELLNREPANALAQYVHVRTLEFKRETDRAVAVGRGHVWASPREPEPRLALAQALAAAGMTEDALTELKEYLSIAPRLNSQELLSASSLMLALGDVEAAAGLSALIPEEDSHSVGMYLNAIRLNLRQEKNEEARESFAKILKIFPNASIAWFEPPYRRFRDPRVFEEFAADMRKAGMPEWPFGLDVKLEADRIREDELRRLFARPFKTGNAEDTFGKPFRTNYEPTGEVTSSLGMPPGMTWAATWTIDDDRLCFRNMTFFHLDETCNLMFLDRKRSTPDQPWYISLNNFGPTYFTIEYTD